MLSSCDYCASHLRLTNPVCNILCPDCINMFPFSHYEFDDDFNLNMYSFFSIESRHKYCKVRPNEINPFEMNKHEGTNFYHEHLQSDVDEGYPEIMQLDDCKYSIQFNSIFADEFKDRNNHLK